MYTCHAIVSNVISHDLDNLAKFDTELDMASMQQVDVAVRRASVQTRPSNETGVAFLPLLW